MQRLQLIINNLRPYIGYRFTGTKRNAPIPAATEPILAPPEAAMPIADLADIFIKALAASKDTSVQSFSVAAAQGSPLKKISDSSNHT